MKGDKQIKDTNKLALLEESVRAQGKREQIETAILGSLSLIGLFSAAALAPNAVQVLHKAFPDLRPAKQKYSVKRAIGRLIKNGLIKKRKDKYYLTKSGEARLSELMSFSYKKNTKQKWDKKWRVVMYDIPEKNRFKRNELRDLLVRTGFIKLQDSVWIYPFRCDEIVALLKFKLRLGRMAVYMIVDAVENDEWLRKHFGLPKQD